MLEEPATVHYFKICSWKSLVAELVHTNVIENRFHSKEESKNVSWAVKKLEKILFYTTF